MLSNQAIKIKNICKSYHVYNNPIDRLKQIFNNKKIYFKEYHALNGIDFEVNKGDSIGIIGRNGSGKSTLLQIIAGTLAPTSGEVQINGRIAALLELGSGFNPEFTGRENVYLYGSIYGISRSEMDIKINEILEFADIGDFIDQPVKTYSSGMFVRLAFSVVVNVDADILIVDEALSVGDMFFQAKCFEKLNQLKQNGVTLLFVSHSIETVKALCNKCIVLKNGVKEYEGEPMKAADIYSKISLSSNNHIKNNELDLSLTGVTKSKLQPDFEKRISQRFGEGKAQYTDAWIISENGEEVDTLIHGHVYTIIAQIQFFEKCEMESEFGVVVRNQEGVEIYALNSFFNGNSIPPQKEGNVIQVEFKHRVDLSPGHYNVSFGLRTPVQGPYNDKIYNAIIFRVVLDYGKSFVPGLIAVSGEVKHRELIN